MHEMGIARSLLEIIKREMKRSKVRKLKKVRVKIGELTAVEPEALRFCFEASIKDTDLDGAILEIEDVPLSGECVDCRTKFRFQGFVSLLPLPAAAERSRKSRGPSSTSHRSKRYRIKRNARYTHRREDTRRTTR